MKWLVALLLIPALSFGQRLNCMRADSYERTNYNGKPERVNKPCAVCYSPTTFSYYTPDLGVMSYRIVDEGSNISADSSSGTITEIYMNDESPLARRGDYVSVITRHGNKIDININFTRAGTGFHIAGKKFILDDESFLTKATKK